jgi:drug/metabolite transporter (DMT)-like permease
MNQASIRRVNQPKAYLLALLTVLSWSTVATAFKIALREMNYIQVLLVANSVALLVYGSILAFRRQLPVVMKLSAKDAGLSIAQGLLNPFAYYLILFKVYSILPAQVAQPVNFVWPLVLMLLSAPLLKQKITLTGFLALIISFTGVVVLSSQGNLVHFRLKDPAGVALALFSSVVWSTFWILNMRDKRDDVIKLFLSALVSFISIVILATATGDLAEVFHKSPLPAVYIGLFEMGIPFVLWLSALQLSETTDKISSLIYLTPFMSLVFIHTILKEQLYYTSYIGLVLIVTGILVQRIKKSTT